MEKVAIIGAGHVGATTALYVAEKRTANVVLLDVESGRAHGKSMDLDQAYPIRKFDVQIAGGSEPSSIADSQVVVVTAAKSGDPTNNDPDLMLANARVVKSACEWIREYAPNAVVLMVTTPINTMTFIAREYLGFPRERVVGMAGAMDSARLRFFLARTIGVSPADTTAMVLGGHGKYIIPVPRYSNVAGIPVTELLPYEKIQDLVEWTRNADASLFALLKTRTANHTPAAAVAEMVECIVRDRRRMLSCSVCLEGEYGIRGSCVSVPVILGRKGVEKIWQLQLLDSELGALQRAGDKVAELIHIWRSSNKA
jgi:malate dehydrogenase